MCGRSDRRHQQSLGCSKYGNLDDYIINFPFSPLTRKLKSYPVLIFDIDDLVPGAPPLSRDVGRINIASIPVTPLPIVHPKMPLVGHLVCSHGLPHSHHQISPTTSNCGSGR